MSGQDAHVRELARLSVWLHFAALVISVLVYAAFAAAGIEPSDRLDTALLALMAYAGASSLFQWAKDRRLKAVLGSLAHALAEDSTNRLPIDRTLRREGPRAMIVDHGGYREAPTVDLRRDPAKGPAD